MEQWSVYKHFCFAASLTEKKISVLDEVITYLLQIYYYEVQWSNG